VRRATAVALLLGAALAVAAGCGGGGGGKRLTKAELIARGDAICAKYRAKNRALNREAPAKNPTDPSASDADVRNAAPVLRKVADNVREAKDEFARLKPPRDVESDWRNTLDDLDEVASKLDEAADAAANLDRQRVVNVVGEILRLNGRVSSFETGYGFRVCGRSR
jgi:hypothetical protein